MKMNKPFLKKAGIVLAFVVLGITLMASMNTDESPADRAGSEGKKDSGYHDQKLDDLRERKAELDRVYEGSDRVMAGTDAGGEEGSPYAAMGGLSDFDAPSPSEPPVTSPATSTGQTAQAIVDEDGSKPSTTGDESSDDGEAISLEAQAYSTLDQPVRMPTHPDRDMPPLSQAQIKKAVDSHIAVLTSSRAQLDNEYDERFEAISDQLENLQRQQDSNSSHPNTAALSKELENVKKRLLKLEGDVSRSATKSSSKIVRASAGIPASQLRNLYRLKAIDGASAVLIGSNTDRVYRFQSGDRLAYGGTLKSIKGGGVTLSWPQTEVVLSVY